MPRPVLWSSLGVLPLLCLACGSLEPAGFEGIGDLQGGRIESGAEDVSDDGSRVAGYSHADDPAVVGDEDPANYGQAALWYEAGTLPGDPRSTPAWAILRPLGYLLPSNAPETAAFGISGVQRIFVLPRFLPPS